jgi:hypothetical protein
MAKAKDKPTREWRPLNSALEAVVAIFGAQHVAEHQVRFQLHDGQVSYRYLDAGGIEHENDLPEIFWRFAKIEWAEGWAVCLPGGITDHDQHGNVRHRDIRKRIEAYRIQVLLPVTDDALTAAVRNRLVTDGFGNWKIFCPNVRRDLNVMDGARGYSDTVIQKIARKISK